MDNSICQFCGKIFYSKFTMIKHQKTAKFCIKLQDNQNEEKKENETISCNYCFKYCGNIDVLNVHLQICKEKELATALNDNEQLKQKIEGLKDTIKDMGLTIERNKDITYELKYFKKLYDDEKSKTQKLEQRIEKLENDLLLSYENSNKSLEKITNKAIENTGTKMNNTQVINNRNQILNNLQPLTDDYMKEQTKYLTMDHIKHGPESFAIFAKDFTFKDRIAITDASRKKIMFKDENGSIISDFNGVKITDKFLEINKEVIEQNINDYLEVVQNKIYGSEWRNDNTSTSFYQEVKRDMNKLLSIIKEKDAPENIKGYNEIKNDFVSHLIKSFDTNCKDSIIVSKDCKEEF